MELSIIVTSYKNPELLRECLRSIKKTYQNHDFEIIVADGETEEDTEMMMREDFPEAKFIGTPDNIGFGELVRKAYELSGGKYILILNSDIIIIDKAIQSLLDYEKNHPEVGVVSPKLLGFNGKWQRSCFRFYRPMTVVYRRTLLGRLPFGKKHIANFIMSEFDGEKEKEVDWVQGSAIMTSREAVEKVGLYDKRFRMYFEDVDWCRRFWENGYKVIYFPDSQMYHYHGRGSKGKNIFLTLIFNKLAWLHIISALKYFWKYLGKPMPEHN